jgi:alpha-amylase
MQKSLIPLLILALIKYGCIENNDSSLVSSPEEIPFTWNNANVYFLLTDRFNNSDPSNDVHFNRNRHTAVNRGFQGGDLAGITEKIEEGYFNELGISAIWMTPFHEQIHGLVDEGTGSTYGYHGYWIRDWTSLDPNFGTEEELAKLVETAHKHGIRVIMDVIVNHTGPVTELDPLWGDNWVRTGPKCEYQDYRSTVTCTLVENLPDIKTESEQDVTLPSHLLKKWESEGRLDQELAELEAFFEETGYPRAPKYYIIKWLTDYVRKYGINGYRLDTAKHTEEGVWAILRKEADRAYQEWKSKNPDSFPEEEQFYMVGEVYNYMISGGRWFDFGDTLVDFYAEGIDHLINFEFKYDALNHYEELFSKYASALHNELSGQGVMNYISSHDDGQPFDKNRENPFEAATKLLLCPGASQIYYGDETSRLLFAPGAEGDANLRSFMNWGDLEENAELNGVKIQQVLEHYQKLGQFRQKHPAVGAGTHQLLSMDPYIFSRSYAHGEKMDVVVVGLDLPRGMKTIPVEGIFENGTKLTDNYSGESVIVKNGVVEVESDESIVLLGKY